MADRPVVDGSLGAVSGALLLDGGTVNAAQGTSGQTITIDAARVVQLANGKSSGLAATNGSTLAYAGVLAEAAVGSAASLRIGSATQGGTVLLGGANTYAGDLLNGTDLTFGGALNLDFSQTFADGTTFDLFTPELSSSLAGNFSSIAMVGSAYTDLTFTNDAGLWTTNTGAANQSMSFNSTTGELSIIAVPEPSLAALGLATALGWHRRRCR